MSENLPAVQSSGQLASALTPDDVVGQVQLVQQVMERAMKKDEHYGVIPGTQKPSLYKAGAEKLSLTFRLAPLYEITKTNHQRGHVEYRVVCTLTHTPTGTVQAQGVGCCSTMESKYKYRMSYTPTGEAIPKDYRDRKEHYKKQGFTARKDDSGEWTWVKKERAENPDIADQYNTVLKMAKKRAYVDAMISATAASDIFTQDIEEFSEPDHPAQPQQRNPRQSDGNFKTISEPQARRWRAIANKNGWTKAAQNKVLESSGYSRARDISPADYEGLCNAVSTPMQEEMG